jgi:kumamolisin
MKKLRPYLRRRLGAPATSSPVSYTPDQVAALYQFPKVPDGPDQTIAIIELGGGFREEDIQSYFAKLNLPAPQVEAVSVDGGANAPGVDENADGEVMLDILVAAAAYSYSTAKPARIKVFFAPDASFAKAVEEAANHPDSPCVCSISWGAPENQWSDADVAKMEAALTVAAQKKMTVLAAAGDNGSGDGERGHHVDYPASSPQVIGCGGTSLRATGGVVHSEMVWNDGSRGGATGGGFSARFHKPPYQAAVKHITRGVPDIAGCADPNTGYVVVVDGKAQVIGGTSAVSPLMSALIAVRCRAKGARAGFMNDTLYREQGLFRDVLLGNNGAFKAASGWDPATGLGVPDGSKI